jgi:hypothetical protein
MGDGSRLNGANRYTITFPKDQTPPVDCFWSLTLYNKNHFFEPNPIKRYSVGTKNKTLKFGADGSLIVYVQADSPGNDRESNWLHRPRTARFRSTFAPIGRRRQLRTAHGRQRQCSGRTGR